MWWSRALALLVLLPALAACGFTPLYGRKDGATDRALANELAAIRVLPIPDRLGQQVRNALVERLTPMGEPARARYQLDVMVNESVGGTGQRKDSKATMGQLTLSATYKLSLGKDKVYSGSTRSIVSFNFLGPRYGSVAGERDAEERAVGEVAEEIRNQVALILAGYRTQSQPEIPQ